VAGEERINGLTAPARDRAHHPHTLQSNGNTPQLVRKVAVEAREQLRR
jgi:hypothetical protein